MMIVRRIVVVIVDDRGNGGGRIGRFGGRLRGRGQFRMFGHVHSRLPRRRFGRQAGRTAEATTTLM
jgi:hypothetical protein